MSLTNCAFHRNESAECPFRKSFIRRFNVSWIHNVTWICRCEKLALWGLNILTDYLR